MFRRMIVVFTIGIMMTAGCSQLQHSGDGSADLSGWKVAGNGTVKTIAEENAVRVTEGLNSKGITLISPDSYGRNVVMTFSVKPERREGVCVVFLSAADKDTGDISAELNSDGGIGYWTGETVQNYMFAFHTAYHQPNIFIKKNPGGNEIVQTTDVAGDEKWYDIEIGRAGTRLWMKVDGITAVEDSDPDGKGLPDGYIGIRLRGPGDGSFSCLFKNLKISRGK